MQQNHLTPEYFELAKEKRLSIKKHTPIVVLFTGLSGSGKSTIARALELYLLEKQIHTMCLDGDNLRSGLNSDLDFTILHRNENLRRVGEVCKLMLDAGIVVIVSFIAPLKANRDLIRDTVGSDCFIEVFIDTPLLTCEERDVKGLYALARAGKLKNFTGIGSPYEVPKNPDLHIRTKEIKAESAAVKIADYIMPMIQP